MDTKSGPGSGTRNIDTKTGLENGQWSRIGTGLEGGTRSRTELQIKDTEAGLECGHKSKSDSVNTGAGLAGINTGAGLADVNMGAGLAGVNTERGLAGGKTIRSIETRSRTTSKRYTNQRTMQECSQA